VEETQIIVAVIVGAALALCAVLQYYRFRNRLKDILREHLTDPHWTWRSFEGLQRAIHADERTTTDLLTDIGARRSEKDKDVWILE